MSYALCFLFPITMCVASKQIDEIPYSVAENPWQKSLGNHRAIASVPEKAGLVKACIYWRRHDPNTENKNILVYNASSGKQVTNVIIKNINCEFGEIIFQPDNSPDSYYIYYMPYTEDTLPWGYKTFYLQPQDLSDPEWREKINIDSITDAKVIGIQSRTEFDRFDPMEIIATSDETKEIIEQNSNKTYLLFPEDRKYPIRMSDSLPL